MNLKDIARLAGVSHMTVSRVINKHPNVKPETRETIMSLIREHGYTPHTSARALVSGKTYIIGLLLLFDMQRFPYRFLPQVLIGMSTRLLASGYNLTLLFDSLDGKRNQVPEEMFTSNKMDGVLVLSTENENEVAERIKHIKIPLVLVNQRVKNRKLNCVVVDDEGGAYEVVSHLLSLGHKKIAMIEGTPTNSTSIDRRNGYRKALSDAGIKPDTALEKAGYFNSAQGHEAMMQLLEERKDITAVFAANDLMAAGAVRAIRERGLSIPGDIAVAGFDDEDFTSVMDPPLTTVNKPRMQMGNEAAGLMLELIADGLEAPRELILPTRLVVRASTGGSL